MGDVEKQFLAIFNGVGLSILTVWLVNTICTTTLYVLNGAYRGGLGELLIYLGVSIFCYLIAICLFLNISKHFAKIIKEISNELN